MWLSFLQNFQGMLWVLIKAHHFDRQKSFIMHMKQRNWLIGSCWTPRPEMSNCYGVLSVIKIRFHSVFNLTIIMCNFVDNIINLYFISSNVKINSYSLLNICHFLLIDRYNPENVWKGHGARPKSVLWWNTSKHTLKTET